jgi:cell division protein FtsI (penicillin-binding protein 3)
VRDRRARSLNLSYEPGSVEKVLTLSALIDTGKVSARTKMLVPGELQRQDRVIHDHWEHGLIKLTLAGVLAKSSNVGTVLASDRFAPGELRSYLDRFGLGRPTNVGLGAESRGILPDPSAWTDQTEDRISFGQSLSVNAVQMAAAVNTIANGGVRVDPTLIQGQATRDDGMTVGTDVSHTSRVVSEEAAGQVNRMMQLVVQSEDAVAPNAAVPGYTVAGKTGTAQRVGKCGCYDGSTTVSFAGFAPAQDPRFTVYVAIQAPREGSGGGSTAGPVFSQLMGFTLQRYGVPQGEDKQRQLPVEW